MKLKKREANRATWAPKDCFSSMLAVFIKQRWLQIEDD